MTKEINNVLYNKTKGELTFEDKLYINKIVEMAKFEKKDITLKSIVFSLVNLLWIVPAVIFVITQNYLPGVIGIATLGAAIVAGGISGFILLKKDIVKSLNLTKQDWKELKKSGRVEDLAKMLEGENIQALDKISSLTSEINELKKEDADKSWQEETEKNKIIHHAIDFDAVERKHYLYCSIQSKTQERRRLIEAMIKNNEISQAEANNYLLAVEDAKQTKAVELESTSNI